MIKKIITKWILSYLKFWAVYRLSRINPQIIGVTGSVGKSSCVYLLDVVLSKHYRTKTTYHGNSETGLPLELLDLRSRLDNPSILNWLKVLILTPFQAVIKLPKWQYLIAEMGIDSPYEPKNMSYLLKIIQPDIGIFLSIAPVHTEQFMGVVDIKSQTLKDDLQNAIAAEKGKLLISIPPQGLAIYNSDSPSITRLTNRIKAKQITIGVKSPANYRLLNSKISLSGTIFELQTPTTAKIKLNLPHQILFPEFAANVLAVLALADYLGYPTQETLEILSGSFQLPAGRQTIINGPGLLRIIDSSYNSSPMATTAFLELIRRIKVKGKKIACLGDMNELGELAPQEHAAIGRLASQTADIIVLVGDLMYQYALPAAQSSKPKIQIYAFKTSQGVGDFIRDNLLSRDDLLLVKGSQNRIFLEQVLGEILISDPQSQRLLCRQSQFWQQKRLNYFHNTPNQLLFSSK